LELTEPDLKGRDPAAPRRGLFGGRLVMATRRSAAARALKPAAFAAVPPTGGDGRSRRWMSLISLRTPCDAGDRHRAVSPAETVDCSFLAVAAAWRLPSLPYHRRAPTDPTKHPA